MKENTLMNLSLDNSISPVVEITPFTLQDYPDHLACILWVAGCNFRCVYCHNPELIEGNFTYISKKGIFDFLNSRYGLLDGIVFSGGECTMNPNLLDLIKEIKQEFPKYKIKIDTNGSCPEVVRDLLNFSLVNFIAIDYKATSKKYAFITKTSTNTKVIESIKMIVNTNIEKEVRITVHTDFLDEIDINTMLNELSELGYKGNVFLQTVITKKTLANLPPQSKILDLSKIICGPNINLFTRNF